MRIASTLFVLWGAMAYLRCLDARNRRRVAVVAAILSLWMLLVIVRWKMADGPLKTFLWYAYYIPLTVLPLLCLLCALRASGLDRRPWAKPLSRVLWCVAAAIIILVLTNDMHEQVFRFASAIRSDSGLYAYVWGHTLLVAWSVGCYLAFFTIFLVFSRSRLKPLVVPVVIICLVGIVFCALYGMRRSWAFRLNFSLVYAILVATVLELCIDLGFIASSHSFTPLFDSLPLDLKVVGKDGTVFRTTRSASPLGTDVCDQLVSMAREADVHDAASLLDRSRNRDRQKGSATFTLTSHPGQTFHVWRLAGGTALLTQDTSDLDAVTHALAARRDELRRTNEMLEHRRQTEGLLEELTCEQALMDDVEQAISSSMNEITALLDHLPANQDPSGDTRRQHALRKARMILAYCKRKSSLVLFENADPELDRQRIGLIANELASDLRAVGIDCAAVVRLSHAVPAHDTSVLYDCIYEVAFVAFACTDPVLMYFLGERDDGMVELRAQLQSEDDDDLTLREESTSLLELLAHRDVIYALTGGPGSLRLVARVRGEMVA